MRALKYIGAFLIAWLSCLSATAVAAEPEYSKIKCSELGRKFSAEFKKEYASDIATHWGNPEFFYNSALGTCLVYTEISDGELEDTKAIFYYRRITDIYSNKVLAYSRYFIYKSDPTKETLVNLRNVGDAVNLSPDKFAAAKAKLFGN